MNDGLDDVIEAVGGTFFCVCKAEVFPFFNSDYVECHECGRNYARTLSNTDTWIEAEIW